GMVVVVVLPPVVQFGFGVHLILRVSLSFGGAVLESAMTVTLPLPGFCLLPFVFKGTTIPAEVPHAVLERSGTLKVPVAGAITVGVTLVSGGCGVHLGTFGSVWLRQSATPMVHCPQVVAVSQVGWLS